MPSRYNDFSLRVNSDCITVRAMTTPIRARMLHGSISNSEKVANLSCDGARLLFTWIIPHCDNLGRIRAEPIQLKANVMPRHPSTLVQIERWTEELDRSGLTQLYKSGGQRFLVVTNWDRYQRLVGNMSRTSELPPPPERRMNDVYTPYIQDMNGVSQEGKGEGEGEGEGKTLGHAVTDCDDSASKEPESLTVPEWFEEVFWPRYPKRVQKPRALRAMLSAFRGVGSAREDELASAMMTGLERYRERIEGKDPQFVMHPATWLNGRCWEYEIDTDR